MAAIYFCIFMGLNAVAFWIPSLLRQVGVHALNHIGWMSGAISMCTAIGIVLIGRHSDRKMERRWHVAGSGFVVALCFLLLPFAARSIPATFALLVIASVGIYTALSLFWTIPTRYLQKGAMAGGVATITGIGAIGGAVSPSLVGMLQASTGSLYAGLAAVGLLLAVGMVVLLRVVRPPSLELPGAAGVAASR